MFLKGVLFLVLQVHKPKNEILQRKRKKNKEKFLFLRSPFFGLVNSKNGLLKKKTPFLQAQKLNLFLFLLFLFFPSCKTKKWTP
jgi:AAA+ ATPase superfamily predicted ATPase